MLSAPDYPSAKTMHFAFEASQNSDGPLAAAASIVVVVVVLCLPEMERKQICFQPFTLKPDLISEWLFFGVCVPPVPCFANNATCED